MTYHILKEVFEFLTAMSWPLTSLLIFYYLKDPLIDFLKNIKKVSYAGAEFVTNQQKINETEIDLTLELPESSNLNNILNKFSKTSNDFAEQILENETQISEISNTETKIERLFNYSKLLIIIKTAERIYYSIYGSQIRILQRLNHSNTEKIDDLKFYFENAQKTYPTVFKEYSYENYLYFLQQNGLIQLIDNNATITDVGRDFLRFIIESNLSFEKLY